MNRRLLATVVVAIAAIVILGASGSTSKSGNGAATTTTSAVVQGSSGTSATTKATTPPPTTVPVREVTGKATTLGAGTFSGGTDVVAGLYDVTPGAGQGGNFIVQGKDSYDEVLGNVDGLGVPKVRVTIASGDSIQISGLSQVVFTPVTTPLVSTHSPAALYAGTWTVGQDLGPGRYVATPGAGQSGNFIVMQEGVDEILGDSSAGGVPNVTVTLHNGDVIDISGLGSVMMTPA